MSDFLCYFGNQYKGQDLFNLIKKPYGSHAPRGQSFDFSWGSMAVLEDYLAGNKNIIMKGDTLVSWIGDLVLDISDQFIADLLKRIQELRDYNYENTNLNSDKVFSQLNGAFAILIANSTKVIIITDMLAFTQIYKGNDKDNNMICFGTHPDLVSSLCRTSRFDLISIGEYISQGTTRFPHTMYKNVKELDPGSVYIYETNRQKIKARKYLYWYPPKEIKGPYDKDSLVEELREKLITAVQKRSKGEKIGVTLSGGLDSRLLLAVVPQATDCIGLTFCDHINRETRIAKKVAQCYKREWIPIFRKRNFLADCLVKTIELQGCEFEFFNAHAVGIDKEISKLSLDTILGGMQMDVYLKGFFANDWFCRKRMKGLLSDKYENIDYDCIHSLSTFDSQILTKEIVKQILSRRQQNYSDYADHSRSSICEWLTLYPFSQDKIGACWAAERRILPMRLISMDRELLEFAFSCPTELKLGSRIFKEATFVLYGRGINIPSANDGVKPGSGHWWRLVQRAIRKLQVRIGYIFEKLGIKQNVQHSWHNYQEYWHKNEKIHELIREYGPNLDQFDGTLFKQNGRTLLQKRDIDWHYGFRLLQLSVWLGIISKYKNIQENKLS